MMYLSAIVFRKIHWRFEGCDVVSFTHLIVAVGAVVSLTFLFQKLVSNCSVIIPFLFLTSVAVKAKSRQSPSITTCFTPSFSASLISMAKFIFLIFTPSFILKSKSPFRCQQRTLDSLLIISLLTFFIILMNRFVSFISSRVWPRDYEIGRHTVFIPFQMVSISRHVCFH